MIDGVLYRRTKEVTIERRIREVRRLLPLLNRKKQLREKVKEKWRKVRKISIMLCTLDCTWQDFGLFPRAFLRITIVNKGYSKKKILTNNQIKVALPIVSYIPKS